MLAHQELSDRIIGAAILVHRTRGPGFVDIKVGDHQLDLFVENEMVVSAKARDQKRHRAPPLLSWIPNFLPS